MKALKAALFDLDGTLLDTRDMILTSFRYAYKSVFGEEQTPPDEQLLSLIGIPLKQQMEMISPEHSAELFDAYHEKNREIHDSMLKGFSGTAEALERIKNAGLRMAVVTSKRHMPAVKGLERMELAHYFEFVIGSDDCEEHKPNPGPLLLAAQRMELEGADCAYIGDSPYDMEAACGAGMFAVGALWGMFTQERLEAAGAQTLVSSILELPEVLK